MRAVKMPAAFAVVVGIALESLAVAADNMAPAGSVRVRLIKVAGACVRDTANGCANKGERGENQCWGELGSSGDIVVFHGVSFVGEGLGSSG